MYDPAKLTPIDPASLPCALAWARFWLGDTSETPQYSDAELTAALTLGAVWDTSTIPPTPYLRPHVLAALLLAGDTAGLSQYRLGDVTETYRDPGAIGAGILEQGRAWDALIPALLRPASLIRGRVDIVPGRPRETF